MKICFNCQGTDIHEVNSTSMGSLSECKSCGLRTPYGATGVSPVQHPKQPTSEEIKKQSKRKGEIRLPTQEEVDKMRAKNA